MRPAPEERSRTIASGTSNVRPSRSTCRRSVRSALTAMAPRISWKFRTGSPSMAVIRSPVASPAAVAGGTVSNVSRV